MCSPSQGALSHELLCDMNMYRTKITPVLPGLGHHSRRLIQELGLVIRVKTSSVRHVIQDVTARQAIPGETGAKSHALSANFIESSHLARLPTTRTKNAHSRESLRQKTRQQTNAAHLGDEKSTE